MDIGAVIVAAGLSSRMGAFKPMLSIGPMSMAQRIAATFRQVGVGEIAVVTGYNAQELERHLAKSGVTFLRNERYAATKMFDSAKIGLSYMRERCEKLLFTPVDIPLFAARTVERLLSTDAELVSPVCEGQRGHPLLMSSGIIERVLEDSGDGGLCGAVSRLGISMTQVEVDDRGVLHDADTPEEFAMLLEYHNGGASVCGM